MDLLPAYAGQDAHCLDRDQYNGTCSWLALLRQTLFGLGIERLLLHVMGVSFGGVAIVHERPVPIGLRQIERLPPQLVGDLPPLVMLADGVGAGAEQTVDGVLLVLLFLVHHGSVLAAGHAAVLGGDAVAVFGNMGGGRQKVAVAVSAPAWPITMLQTVLQIKHIKVNETFADHLLNRYPLLFVTGVLEIGKTRDQPGK